MKNIRLLLIEDDKEFMYLLKILLGKIGVGSVATASTSAQAWSEFQRFKPNVCLVDIVLGKDEKAGIKLAEKIRRQDEDVKLIFMTSHFTEENYQEVKSLKPHNFMGKELSSLKLRQAIELAWNSREMLEADQAVMSSADPTPNQKMVGGQYFFKVGDSLKAIDLTEVSYFHADGKMTFARIGNRNYATNVQLKVLEAGLSHRFLRCHKKYLINTEKITSIKTRDDKVCMGEESLPIGYAYRKSFLGGLNILK